MITKKEHVHMDAYNSQGIKTMDVRGMFDFDDLSTEMVRTLANKQIPVIRRASAVEEVEEKTVEESMDEITMEAESALTLKWRFDGVEFMAEGPAEYVLRASAELLEYLEALT